MNVGPRNGEQFRRLTPDEVKARARRNMAIAWSLAVMVVIFFVVTLVQLSGNVAQDKF
jgi:hypothetical protein